MSTAPAAGTHQRRARSASYTDLDLIAYEMTMLAEAAGAVLTPGVR